MLRLRQLHLRAHEDPEFVEPDPRAAMAELARAFPGALREIDELPLAVIEARIAELALAEQERGGVRPWMLAQVRFHALARGALAVKRWLAGRTLTPRLEAELVVALTAMPEREDAEAWATELGAIARPPRGRIMDLVYARLARELDTDVATARAAVTPPCASLRRRRP